MIPQLASHEQFDEVKEANCAIALHRFIIASEYGFACAAPASKPLPGALWL